jgi:hypothetical protein
MKSRHMSESSDGFESPIGRVIALVLAVVVLGMVLQASGVRVVWPFN